MNATRPATGHLSHNVVTLVLCNAPMHATEHLVHAWDALRAASEQTKREANIDYARSRVACIESDPVWHGIKLRQRAAVAAELVELRQAIAALG